jgi:peptide/nickel transport system ATP-binding protein
VPSSTLGCDLASTTDPLLSVRRLNTRYRGDRGPVSAVDDVSFTIGPGKRFAIVGESGCGKTATVLSLLRLIDPPNTVEAESLTFDGRDLLALSPQEMRHVRGREIAMVMQDPLASLSPTFRVGEQIAETIRMHGLAGRRAARARSIELLRRVGVPDPSRRVDWYPHQLSGGLRQRVALAIALSCDPRLLIADEPTTALDVTVQAQVMDLLLSLAEERHMAVLLITHDLGVVAGFAEAMAVMYAGRIVETGSVDDVLTRPRHPYTRALLAAQPSAADGTGNRLRAIPGAPPRLDPRPAGCAFQARCSLSHARARCTTDDPALYEIDSNTHRTACHFAHELQPVAAR